MLNHVITNTTTSHLDMSPLKDVFGRLIALRPSMSCAVDDETLGNPIAQRVLGMGWISVAPASAVEAPPAAVTPPPEPLSAPPTAVTPPPAPPSEPPAAVTPPPEPLSEPPPSPSSTNEPTAELDPVAAPGDALAKGSKPSFKK